MSEDKREIVRMTPEILAALEAQLVPPDVSASDSEAMLGFRLGVQTVLKKLRDGYTVRKK